MRKLVVFLILGILVSVGAAAQQKPRKIPFLPYAGMPIEGQTATGYSSSRASVATSAPALDGFETVYFKEGSAEPRKDQLKKLVHIGKRLEREGGSFFTVLTFTTRNISMDLARRRAEYVVQALQDFRIGEPIYEYEHRNSPVINPNRVEIYLNTTSLGNN